MCFSEKKMLRRPNKYCDVQFVSSTNMMKGMIIDGNSPGTHEPGCGA